MSDPAPLPRPDRRRSLVLHVNGRAVAADIAVEATLAQLLRENLGLTGTKIACDQAACGACTIILDGRPVFACHTLAAQLDGSAIETIEGLADGEDLHPLQAAFIAHDALQCGFCTPGMILALKAAIDDGMPATRAALAGAISGNLCRCGAYEHIIDAALTAISR